MISHRIPKGRNLGRTLEGGTLGRILRNEPPRKKSQSQLKLEKEGWEFLTNADPRLNPFLEDHSEVPLPGSIPMTNSEMEEVYSREVFKRVKVTDIYSKFGEYIPNLRRVYTKPN